MTNCLGPRKFLHSGKLYKAKSNKELYGFLFNDFLLLTQVTRPLGSSASDKVFSAKSHLQYRMYKTVRFGILPVLCTLQSPIEGAATKWLVPSKVLERFIVLKASSHHMIA